MMVPGHQQPRRAASEPHAIVYGIRVLRPELSACAAMTFRRGTIWPDLSCLRVIGYLHGLLYPPTMARAEGDSITRFSRYGRRTASDEKHRPSIQPTNRLSSLARGCDFRDRDDFPVFIDIASQLNACTRVRGERRKALVLDLKDFVTAHEHVLRSALDTSECAFLGFLSHLAHRVVVLAAHIVTDPTRQRLRSGPD